LRSTLSIDAKDSLAHEIPEPSHCREALRNGLLLYGVAENQGVFSTQRLAVARLGKTLFDLPIRKVTSSRLRGLPTYEIDVAVLLPTGGRKPSMRCDRRIEIRAAFLSCGSLAQPQRGYHLEFTPPTPAAAQRLASLLRAEGRRPKQSRRRQSIVVYFKGVDEITQVLTSIGAFTAVLRLEGERALKETKNRIHRLVNTEAANVDRAVDAASRQRETIGFLAQTCGLQQLAPSLREIAELRLQHPTETLRELGSRCRPPAGKSTVNARFAILSKLAERLRFPNKTKGSATNIR
jgi:WhiA C-terminal HTH domain/WhiA LAGLIDADG-like domain